jgi:hypothetical protein
MRVQVANTGLEDAKNLTLVAEAHQGERSVEIARQAIDVLSQNPIEIVLNWQPTLAGPWIIEIHLEDLNGRGITTTTLRVAAITGAESSLQTILSASTGNGQRLAAYLVLIALALSTALAVKRNRARTEAGAEP